MSRSLVKLLAEDLGDPRHRPSHRAKLQAALERERERQKKLDLRDARVRAAVSAALRRLGVYDASGCPLCLS